MNDRPSLAAMQVVLFDNRGRLRPSTRRMIIEPFHCRRRERHLQGFIVGTVHGPLLAWRVERNPAATWPWILDWLDAVPDAVVMTCHCRIDRLVDVTPYRRGAISWPH